MTANKASRHHRHAGPARLLLVFIAVLVASDVIAAAPRLVPFQARLTDGAGADLTDVYEATFAIYDEPTGGTALWSEFHPSVSVMGGRLNVLLGSRTSLDDPNDDGNAEDAVQFDQPRFVGIKIGVATNQEMVPRHQLVPAFHARNADKLGGYTSEYLVPKGGILMWSGVISSIPNGWALCDGSNGTPDLRDRFILGATGENLGSTGGAQSIVLAESNLPSHSHLIEGFTGDASNDHEHSGTTSSNGVHTHGVPNDYHLSPGSVDTSPNEWGGTPPNAIDQWVTTSPEGAHSHGFTTGGFTQNHSHGISFASGLTGSAMPIDNRPRFYTLAFIMKL